MTVSTFMSVGGRAAAVVLAAALSQPVLAQGVGVPPPVRALYTPGNYGYSPPAVGADLLSPAPIAQGCSWSVIYGSGTGENFAYPEANATYWQASLPLVNPAGTIVRIDGRFPDARFSSISLYNSSYQLVGTLPDYALMPAPGSANTYADRTRMAAGVSYGGAYTAYIVFGAAPAQPAPNTLYVPPQLGPYGASLPSVQQFYLLYRVYGAAGGTASGGTPLPALSSSGTPFSGQTDSLYCQNLTTDLGQSLLYALPLTPEQTALGLPTNPSFVLYNSSVGVGVNGENQYMSANTTLPAGYLYIVRAKAPSHTLTDGGTADVRYWSVCQNTQTSLEVVACVGDFQALLDQDGYYNIVVTDDSAAPAYAVGYNWMPFGPRSPGVVIYRQLLAASGFSGASGSPTMGSYTPEMTYCQVGKFRSLVAQANSPLQVFQACGGMAR